MQKESCLLGCLKENKNIKMSFPKSVIGNLHRLDSTRWRSPIKALGDDKLNNKAFTLIELLVVVLIIGILAAVAMPQYKIAVAKARMTQLVTLANAVVQAQERYYLANGEYTNDWSLLDIEVQGSGTGRSRTNPAGWTLELTLNKLNSGHADAVYATDSRLPGILLIFANQHSRQGRRACYATIGNALANILCKNATHKTNPETTVETRYNVYFFN